MFSPQQRREDDNADKIKSALALAHLTQRAICAIASFRRKLVKQPERAATVVVSPEFA